MAILTTSGIPSDASGSSGDYAIDPAAHFIYGPKTSTWSGTASSLQGPSGPGMVYGQGAPTTNQGAIGQGYLDLATGNFYGPKASNGAWGNAVYKLQGAPGANGTNGSNGLSVLTGTGAPASTLGVDGQTYIDTQVYNIYSRSGGVWSSATSLVGPAGNAPTLINLAASFGPSASANAITVPPSPGVALNFSGTSIPYTFTPQVNTSLVGLQATNYGSSGATVYFYLTDVAANTIVYNYNAGNGLASGTVTSASFAAGTYPLTAGKQYQWGAQRASSGTTSLQINPVYLMPSGTTGSLSYYSPFTVTTSTNVASTATAITFVPGSNAMQQYYRISAGSYLYQIEYWIAGSGKLGPFIFNSTANANQFTLDNYGGYPTLTSTLTRYVVGPFNASTWPFTPNSIYYMSLYAPSGAATVTQFYAQITVGQ